ncbi:MAG: hypothetical protein JOZ75_13730 [Candidatus Dormibacteraeota bacterium]|nr:hypothetical protein [Candidatus Dormibacteraeota bacterium]
MGSAPSERTAALPRDAGGAIGGATLRAPANVGAATRLGEVATPSRLPRATRLIDRVSREHLLLGSLVAFSWGSMVFYGSLDTAALLDIMAALALAGLALRVPPARGCAGGIWWAGAAAISAAGTLRYVGLFTGGQVAWLALAIVAASVVVALTKRRVVVIAGTAAGAGALLVMAITGWQWGRVGIDVFRLLQTATSALLHGQNPYTPTAMALAQTAPGVFVSRPIHFCYFPGAILLAAPGRVFGDVRIMSVFAFVALMAFTVRVAATNRQALRSYRVLALCLAAPTTIAMVYNAWLDVYALAGLAGWLALRQSRLPLSIGCLVVALTVKPTLIPALLPFWLWSRRTRTDTLIALGITALVFLPFVVMTGIGGLYHDVVGLYGQIGFRYDGLTLSAWWYQRTGSIIPVAFSVVAGGIVAYLALRLRPTDLSTPLIAGACITTAAFLLSKQAFLNYYFIPTWLVILALAARGVPFAPPSDVRLPRPLDALVPRAIARRLPSAVG